MSAVKVDIDIYSKDFWVVVCVKWACSTFQKLLKTKRNKC